MTVDRDDRFAVLAMPGYGELTAGASRGFWRATRLPDARVWRQYQGGSLLAANFNALWVSALNLARSGRRVDCFAMQHADVEPEDWWLDTLIDEMEAGDLDILGAVVPIKDHKGLTSVALDRPDGDTWRPLCRLTMQEVHRLPETFTSADVGHPILLNTGLWACRFDESWASKVHFTINDRIAVDPQGRYHAQCEPEDWFFSRLCHEQGLRIGATRKVRVDHRGPATYSNQCIWGEPFDSAWIGASMVPDDLPGWRFPGDVPGWLSYEEGRALAKLAAGKRVLEIGSYMGRSTICMAQTARHVVAVDTWDGRGTPAPRETWREFKANLGRYGLGPKVAACPADWDVSGFVHESDDGARISGPFDLAFIDGAHDAASVAADIDRALAALAPDGLLGFHDYGSPIDPEVAPEVDKLIARGGELVSLTGTVAVVRPPAESLALTPSEA